MNCMKCGREIALGQVFCKSCLADMETAPVDPATPVVLPTHTPNTVVKRSSTRKAPKPEEQVLRLRKLLWAVSLLLAAVSVAFAITTWVLLQRLERTPEAVQPGQNYSTAGDPVG